MMERNRTLDNAKGIGILLVIAGHLFTKGTIPFMYIFAFHMPLFFIISGYLMNVEKYTKFSKCIKASYQQLIKPYFAFCIIGFFISLPIIGGGIFIGKYSIVEILYRILYETFWDVNPFVLLMGALWFLVVLFLSKIFGWIIVKKMWKLKWRYIVFIVLPLLSYGLYIFQESGCMPYWTQNKLPLKLASVPISMMFFLLGYELKNRNFVLKLTWFTPLSFVLAARCIPLNGCVNISIPIFGNILFFILNALLGCYAVLTLSSIKWPRFINWLGQNTLIIFAIHGIQIFVYSQFVHMLLGHRELQPIHSLIGLLIVVVLSWPTVRVVQPVLNYIIRKI